MYREEALKRIKEVRLIAVVRCVSRPVALEVSNALIEGGVRVIEIAYTTPEAERVIEELNSEHGDVVLLGAGTVITPEQVEKSVAAGASFLVSPGFDPGLVSFMQGTGLVVVPGVLTPSEIMAALRCGIQTVKLFPGSLGGPSHVKNLCGPFPQVSFVPTGGVTLDNVAKWFAAGAVAVGVGGALVPENLQGDERSHVAARAREFVRAVKKEQV